MIICLHTGGPFHGIGSKMCSTREKIRVGDGDGDGDRGGCVDFLRVLCGVEVHYWMI